MMDLTHLILDLPCGRRGAMLQAAVSFRDDLVSDRVDDIESLRTAFAIEWKRQYECPVPVKGLQETMQPPLPIGTVLEFNKLMLMDSEADIEAALSELMELLHSKVCKDETAAKQLVLFPVAESSDNDKQQPTASVGTNVSELQTLVKSGHRFSTIYADPPWAYDNTSSRGAAENHYQTMTVDEICAEPVREIVAENAHLHLWTTNAFLRESFDVIESWGFAFKSCFVWTKPEIGMGNYWRVSHEFLLLGVRGALTFRDNTMKSWIESHRGQHSRKPGVIRSLVEKVSPGPYLEMYGREELPHSQWTVYGNQVEKRLF